MLELAYVVSLVETEQILVPLMGPLAGAASGRAFCGALGGRV